MPNRRSPHTRARIAWLEALSSQELLAHVERLTSLPLPDHVFDGLLGSMARLSRKSISDWETKQRRSHLRRPPVTPPIAPTSTRRSTNLVVKLEWREPPQQATTGTRDWAALLAPLRDKPQKWARMVNDKRNGAVQGARAAAKKALPGGEWELVTRREEDGTSSLYARYLGRPP